MRSGLLALEQPEFWVDGTGARWRTLSILGRIKYRYPSAWALRRHVFLRDDFTCQHCGWVADLGSWDGTGKICPSMTGNTKVILVLDHIIPREFGGSHHPENLQSLCDPCNTRKGRS